MLAAWDKRKASRRVDVTVRHLWVRVLQVRWSQSLMDIVAPALEDDEVASFQEQTHCTSSMGMVQCLTH